MKNQSIPASSTDQIIWIAKEVFVGAAIVPSQPIPKVRFAPLQSIRQWLDAIEINNQATATLFCQLIPAQCPFERTIKFCGRTLLQIPPLCKLNPFYEQLVGLRFRALCYLADVCGEDISRYC